MTDFQAGDRVSVEGVVTGRFDGWVQFHTPGGTLYQVDPDELTLIERPRRKLRVGSVWEVSGREPERFVFTGTAFVSLGPFGTTWPREDLNFDEQPYRWREVPVEELEREAAGMRGNGGDRTVIESAPYDEHPRCETCDACHPPPLGFADDLPTPTIRETLQDIRDAITGRREAATHLLDDCPCPRPCCHTTGPNHHPACQEGK